MKQILQRLYEGDKELIGEYNEVLLKQIKKRPL